MDLRARLENSINDMLATGTETICLGRITDFTEDELEIIYEFKVNVYCGSIYLLAPSTPHQAMAALVNSTFGQESKPAVSLFPVENYPVKIYGKYSCGAVKVKRPDCTIQICVPGGYRPVAAECAFRNENLFRLLVETSELLTEFTTFRYCVAFQIEPADFFPAHFYVFERTVESLENPEKILNSPARAQHLAHACLAEDRPINDELFADLKITEIFHHTITAANYKQDFSFELEGKYFGLEVEIVTFRVRGVKIEILKAEFDEYVKLFPR